MTNQTTEQLAFFPEDTLDGKVERAKEIIKICADMSAEYYGKPLIICYSGGKDSDVLLDIARKSGAQIEVLHSLTTVDAPQTVQHIKKVFAECEADGIKTTIKRPTYNGNRITMWSLIPQKKMPPTRVARYCCSVLKEASTPNRFVALGIRRSESANRKDRAKISVLSKTRKNHLNYTLEHTQEVYKDAHTHADVWDCQLISKAKENQNLSCNPIISFTDEDVWRYAEENELELNPLYEMGYNRVGCVGCPMATQGIREKEFSDFPKYKTNYIKAFDRMLQNIEAKGNNVVWETGEDVFNWWLGYQKSSTEQLDGQETLF